MKEISRREFLKLSGITMASAFAPKSDFGENGETEPLTGLPLLYTQDTPIQITFLKPDGTINRFAEKEWLKLSDTPVDILPPITPIHHSSLGIEPQYGFPYAWTTKLPHVTGSPTELLAVVAWGDSALYRQFNGSLSGKNGEIVSTYLYTEKANTYANKIWNDLTSYAAIARWQKNHGPLMPGEEFSFIKETELRDRIFKDYKRGLQLWAGGICATASTLSKAIFLASNRGYTDILRRSLHIPSLQYWASPLDPGVTKENSDATIYFQDDPLRWWEDADLTFRVREDAPSSIYLSFAAQLSLDEKPLTGKDISLGADARCTFSASVKKTPPRIDEEEALLSLRAKYSEFHQFAY